MKSTNVSNKDVRLTARVPEHVQELVQNAADLSGATISQFIVNAALDKAKATLMEMQFITVSEEAADRIYAALEEPPNINQALREVAEKMQAEGGFYYGYSANHPKHRCTSS